MIELLAPAGNLEKLRVAVLYGADAVYVGGKKFSLRARASNFSLADIEEGCKFAHARGAKVYVTVNIVPHGEDLEGFPEYLRELEAAGADGIILTSLYYSKMAKLHAPGLELHLSTQFSSANSLALNFFKKMGFARAVLAREVGLSEIELIKKNTDIDLEVFIHGGMCASYSGRCMLSNYMTDRDANRGGCAHSCRWAYRLYGKGKIMSESFKMGSKDLFALRAIPELINLGVKSLKIEGRMKSVHYIGTTVRVYRMLIDEYLREGRIRDFSSYEQELYKAENRPAATGFLYGIPGPEGQLYESGKAASNDFLGIVLAYDEKTGWVTAEQRNNFAAGAEVEFFGPKLCNTRYVIPELFDENMEVLEVARHPRQIVRFRAPFKLNEYDMFRRV